MKTILDKTTRKEPIKRINLLNENSEALWGKIALRGMISDEKPVIKNLPTLPDLQ